MSLSDVYMTTAPYLFVAAASSMTGCAGLSPHENASATGNTQQPPTNHHRSSQGVCTINPADGSVIIYKYINSTDGQKLRPAFFVAAEQAYDGTAYTSRFVAHSNLIKNLESGKTGAEEEYTLFIKHENKTCVLMYSPSRNEVPKVTTYAIIRDATPP